MSLVGLLLYREYKSDPKRMIELCTSGVLCDAACAYMSIQSTSSDAHGGASSGDGNSKNSREEAGAPMQRAPAGRKCVGAATAGGADKNFSPGEVDADHPDLEMAPLLKA